MAFQDTFKALSDPARREILTILKKAGLIVETKFKNFIYYELNTSVFEEIMLWFSGFNKTDSETKESH